MLSTIVSALLAVVAMFPPQLLGGLGVSLVTEAAKRVDALPIDKSNARAFSAVLSLVAGLLMAYSNNMLAANVDDIIKLLVSVATIAVTAAGSFHLLKWQGAPKA